MDRPDIVITFRNNKVVIIDAKNSDLDNSIGFPYRDLIDSYIQSAGIDKTDFAIFLFSKCNKNKINETYSKYHKSIEPPLSIDGINHYLQMINFLDFFQCFIIRL